MFDFIKRFFIDQLLRSNRFHEHSDRFFCRVSKIKLPRNLIIELLTIHQFDPYVVCFLQLAYRFIQLLFFELKSVLDP